MNSEMNRFGITIIWLISAMAWASPLEKNEVTARIDAALEKLVAEGKTAGVVARIDHQGKTVYRKGFGTLSPPEEAAMTPDAWFRLFSLTKAVTSAAALKLVEQGKIELDAPIQTYLPKVSDFALMDGSQPKRQPTVRDLLRHTAGFAAANHPTYKQAGIRAKGKSLSEQEVALAKVKLLDEPGTRWLYGISSDVLGLVLEKVTGKTLDVVFEELVFAPLGVTELKFFVPEEKLPFMAGLSRTGKQSGQVMAIPKAMPAATEKPVFLSGGGGLYGTVDGYAMFLRGLFEGKLLKEESLALMTSQQLVAPLERISFGEQQRYGVGFGLGFNVVTKDDDRWDPDAKVGEVGWGGFSSLHYWILPKEELIVVTAEQTLPYNWNAERALKGLIYEALDGRE